MSSSATLEDWALALIESRELSYKLSPPAAPQRLDSGSRGRRVHAPERPPELVVVERSPRSPKGLSSSRARARLLHTFFHHELQAAELFAWAILAFPERPPAFRRGLAQLAQEELLHARLYATRLEQLGYPVGSFPVRDWFWERVRTCRDALQFVALVGVGFEGGNLDHCERFAERLRAVGDEQSALLQERIARDEERHVQFALRWFEEWSGGQDFDLWVSSLPAPLSPLVLRGARLSRESRLRAGQSPDFLDALERWSPGG